MDKSELRIIIKNSVEEVWIKRRSMNPIIEQTNLLTEKLWTALESKEQPELTDEEVKPKYYKCPTCSDLIVYEKGQMPYWRPTAQSHQIASGMKICYTKYTEITEEEYIKEIEMRDRK